MRNDKQQKLSSSTLLKLLTETFRSAHSRWRTPSGIGSLLTIFAILMCGNMVVAQTVAEPSPAFSPAGGTYYQPQSVTISDTDASAVIYYTTDGSTPTVSSPVYTGPITVPSSATVRAIAVSSTGTVSSVVSVSYKIQAATVYITPRGATYLTPQTVAMSDRTAGATIYYTTDGSIPTTSSNLYTGSFTVATNEKVTAIAVAPGYANSYPATATYVITPPAAAPTFSPVQGTYVKAQSVTLSCTTSGAVIYYTTDGSTPTTSSAIYSAPLTVSANETITAMALASGGSPSPTASANYVISGPAATPTFSPIAGKYTSVQSVSILDATPNAAIYYTTDGTVPTTSSQLYTGPITVGATETIQAIALARGGTPSPVGKAGYTITLPTATPVISPAGGTYNQLQTVTIADPMPNAVIYYTVNGKYPNSTSSVYTGQPITATTNTVVKAIAIAPNYSASTGAQTTYVIAAPPPVITPASGTFDYQTQITMTDAAPGATIYYTTNGTTPTTASTVYTGPISLSPNRTSTVTFKAVAIANGYLLSAVSSATVTVTLPTGVIANAVVSSTPSMNIPLDFLGLSIDYRTPADVMGQASTGSNPIYRTLVSNLTQYMSVPMLVRVEGDNSQPSDLQPAIEPLAEFAQAVNVNYSLGVDQMHDSPTNAATEAANWLAGIPNNLIRAFEIGNEANAYPWQTLNGVPVRPSTYTFDDYLAEFQQWQTTIQSFTGSGIGSMGPSYSTSTWDADAEAAILSGSDTLTVASQHAYCAGPASGQTLPADYLLEPVNATKLPQGYAPFASAAHQKGVPFRMGEINSISGGGVQGISNTFSAALWSIDIMFNYLANGIDGVNWHSGQNTVYQLFQFKTQLSSNGLKTYSLTNLNPLYYGLLTFAQTTANGAKLLPVSTMTDSNVSIWATVDNQSAAHLIVINKDETATGNIQIQMPGYSQATVRYLTAPSITSQTGVSLGGQTFDGSTDGTIQGSLVTSTVSGNNGVFTLANMPVTTAAILDFTK